MSYRRYPARISRTTAASAAVIVFLLLVGVVIRVLQLMYW